MREIKFRGIRRDNKEFVYGDGIHFPKSINYKGRCYIDGMQERANDWIEVAPETVGQFTGRKDKKGKEIYEGDILRVPYYTHTYLCEVRWSEEGYWYIKHISDERVEKIDEAFIENMQIIGNIYEHRYLIIQGEW